MHRTTLSLLALGLLAAACASSRETPSPQEPPPEPPAEAPAPPSSTAAEVVSPALSAREGGALVRAPGGEALYLADEDHAALRRIPLPLDAGTPPRALPLPGRPAQVLAVGDRVLVTVRDPGMLLVLRDRPGEISEEARIPLPADAWGMAVSADGARAVVSSAWTHRVSLVDLGEKRVRWSVEVAREPRGVALRADGTAAWISHLTGTQVTSIEDLDAATPRVRRLALPADPLRSPVGEDLGASLGYSAVLSADEGRLFVARHALGGVAWDAWFGTSTVDVLATRSGEPVAQRRSAPVLDTLGATDWRRPLKDRAGDFVEMPATPFVQPRAMVLRRSTSTLLVAGEGNDALVELDALSIAPAVAPLRIYALAGPERRVAEFDEQGVRWGGNSKGAHFPVSACGAPSGIALAADDEVAYVYCRSTDGLAVVPLDRHAVGPAPRPYRREETYVVARLAADPLPEPMATGRRLFYDATDEVLSGGLGCAACHPEGRDDGFVWREIHPTKDVRPFFVASARSLATSLHDSAGSLGLPRQTPMLAGRVAAAGPYGWLAESASLVDRIREGFALHRWSPSPQSIYDPTTRRRRAEPIADFLREGLVPPPSRGRPLDAEEERGREIFTSETAGCAKCHDPATGYTNRLALPLFGRKLMKGFDPDPAPRFKVPSLFYAGATAPYFHDGAVATLEDLVEQNLDHMGMTTQLTAGERKALVAFLKTIEPDPVPPPAASAGEEVPFAPARTRALPPDERGGFPPLVFPPSNADLPSIDAEPWPETRSPAPSRSEWGEAKPVRLARSSWGCKVKRVREWVRIECGGNALMMAAGSREGVKLDASLDFDLNVDSAITFPVRRGDRRAFQVSSFWKWMTAFDLVSEQWLDGDAAPVITISALYSARTQVLP